MEVAEIYKAPQGEGPNVGKPSIFIRLQGCPVGCSWCDTKYTWPSKSDTSMTCTPQEVADRINDIAGMEISNIVITGGEPMMQRKELERLVSILLRNFTVEIETSGIYMPLRGVSPHYNVSPKLPSASAKAKPSAILMEYISHDTIFKFVISDRKDFDEARRLCELYMIPSDQVYLMPQGVDSETIKEGMRMLENLIMSQWPAVRMTTRLHILMHEQKRLT